MPNSFGLLVKVITFQLPPRILVYALRNKLDRWLKTGNRRFEFERRYLEFPDPWHYHTSGYEQGKYDATLQSALAWRKSRHSALELGCSLGVFTRMLSTHFDEITAADVSVEAIRAAIKHAKSETNIKFVVGDIRSLTFGTKFDVVFCAEVLYYIPQKDAHIVCQNLLHILSSDGIVIMVTLKNKPDSTFFYFDSWEEILCPTFRIISKETIQDPTRPYEIVIFSKSEETSVVIA